MKVISAEQLRFGIVGVANTAVDLITYTVLRQAGLNIILANLISTSAGMALSFTLNRNFTFRAKAGNAKTQAVLFFLVTATGLWLVQPLMISLFSGMFTGLTGTLAIAAPKLAGLGFNLVWNYTLYSKVVFRHRAPDEAKETADD
ncbi:GtrA family protein [Actinocrispum sp. NPDC049592]|uniref:GtrA family protein n=1 Tax=Actinocrispum sp. NPDC049592 TaxID=3154835 RepID=UPI003442A697